MTPTLRGRIETRFALLLLVAVPWTLLVASVLPRPSSVEVLAMYRVTFLALGTMAILGCAWDALYYGGQQLRWDKDWPSLFALLTVLNEGAATWTALHLPGAITGSLGPDNSLFPAFALHFGTAWVLMWLTAQGPMRVLFLRWRFNGGRITSGPRVARR